MKFKTVSKNIFSYTNDKKTLITHHIIENIKLFNQYTILFNSECEKNLSFINIKLYKDNNKVEEILLNINDFYKFQNKNIFKIEININLKEDIIFHLNILEEPIIFKENTYKNSPLVNDFINKIDSSTTEKNKTNPTFNVKIACILDEFY